MRNRNPVLCHGLSRVQANRVLALMLSMGLDAELLPRGRSRYDVVIHEKDLIEARLLLAEEYPNGVPESRPQAGETRTMISAPEFWFGRGTWAVFAVLFVCIAVHFEVHGLLGEVSRSRMIEVGAIAHYLIERGEYWRFFTAVFLHFNVGHLLSNMGTMLLVAPPLAHLLGPWRFLLVFVVTGIAANVVSDLIHPIGGLKAGASGAIAGVLGALGGQALRPDGNRVGKKPWHVIGAMAGFYAMLIGFGPGRDNVAHVAGIIAGIIVGRCIAALPEDAGGFPMGGAPPPIGNDGRNIKITRAEDMFDDPDPGGADY